MRILASLFTLGAIKTFIVPRHSIVAPDIEVIQDPAKRLQGHDPQLERAVEEAMRLLETNEFQLKPEPPPTVRWKRPEGFQN